jgi:CRISPR-associated exonuclease Cas4
MPGIAILLLVLALALLWLASRRQKAAGLPSWRVIYTDTRGWGRVEEPLYAAGLGLAGRPDYLVQKGAHIIPVEVKSSRVVDAPYDEHVFQLAAYCLLVQHVYGRRPPYGIINYPTRTFAIDYTPELEGSLLALLEEMRAADRRKELDRSHDTAARCRGCGYRSVCDQRL